LVWLSYTGRRLDWDEEHRRLKELSSLIINTSFQGTRVETSVEQRSAAGSGAMLDMNEKQQHFFVTRQARASGQSVVALMHVPMMS
jgi:hypothetical protein